MTKELSEHMEALRAIAPKLNKATDDAARVIAVGAGRGAAPPPPRRDFYALAYGRGDAGKFSIHIDVTTRVMELDQYSGAWDYGDDAGSTTIEWSRATRSDRLKSFAALPDLLRDLAANARDQITAAENAMAQVAESLKALGLDGPE